MKTPKTKFAFYVLLVFGVLLFLIFITQPIEIHARWGVIDMLFPKGLIALKERNLLFIIQALMFIVVIPVFVLFFLFSWIYRAGNTKAEHKPDLDDNKLVEWIWWGVPTLLVLVISGYTYHYTHALDPFKPLDSDQKPLKIQVVALQWKWLFIYPEQKIATVNFVQFPEKRPVHFEITADAPMNSFWIPSLAGQIYAMPKMVTQLHCIANEGGVFRGCSANISGKGFAGMYFLAKATPQDDFDQWVKDVGQSSGLNLEEYDKLSQPSIDHPVVLYALEKNDLFDWIVMKYMMPGEMKEQK